VITYGVAVDRRDWQLFGECFTDPVHADYSENGLPAADFAPAELVAVVNEALERYAATQHLSPNHVIEFDEDDDDRATCHSYMYAQHLTASGAVFVLRGSYTNHMRRTAEGWRIEDVIQHVGWSDEAQRTS
jgi:hypothetical protein